VLLFTVLFAISASAEILLSKANAELDLGMAAGITQGSTRWSHDASGIDPLVGNPTSELTYEDLTGQVVEFHGQLTLMKKWFLRINNGYGVLTAGRLIDDDFLSGAGAAALGATVSGDHRSSRTFSDVGDSYLAYVTFDLGYVPLTFLDDAGSIAVFAGYQFWREQVRAKGLTQVECTVASCASPGTVSHVGQTVITNTMSWHTLRLGIESEFQFASAFLIEGSAAFIPVAALQNEDIHHLRTDLQQNPSFSMSGTGIGFNLEGNVSYSIMKHLFLDAGYRYWWLEVTDGTWQLHRATGGTIAATLNQFKSVRRGGTLALTYTF